MGSSYIGCTKVVAWPSLVFLKKKLCTWKTLLNELFWLSQNSIPNFLVHQIGFGEKGKSIPDGNPTLFCTSLLWWAECRDFYALKVGCSMPLEVHWSPVCYSHSSVRGKSCHCHHICVLYPHFPFTENMKHTQFVGDCHVRHVFEKLCGPLWYNFSTRSTEKREKINTFFCQGIRRVANQLKNATLCHSKEQTGHVQLQGNKGKLGIKRWGTQYLWLLWLQPAVTFPILWCNSCTKQLPVTCSYC